jgi:uncharacterized MAPEG superfamily protein
MTIELKMLLLAVLIPLSMVSIQGLLLMRELGLKTLIGNRENFTPPAGWQGRYLRAHANQLENLLLFGLMVLVAHAAGVSNRMTQVAAEIFVAMRLLHVIFYVAGITWPRTATFYTGLLCVFAILWQLLLT